MLFSTYQKINNENRVRTTIKSNFCGPLYNINVIIMISFISI